MDMLELIIKLYGGGKMTEEKADEGKMGEGLMEEHPFYRNRKLKIFILLLT
jgi:hypothetical protein